MDVSDCKFIMLVEHEFDERSGEQMESVSALLEKPAEPAIDDGQDARFPERSRILVIDDDPDVLDVLQRGLSTLGFEMDGAIDGPTGIARYSAGGPFDLVLVDLKMPDMDGIEVIRRLKAQHEDVLVAVITVGL